MISFILSILDEEIIPCIETDFEKLTEVEGAYSPFHAFQKEGN